MRGMGYRFLMSKSAPRPSAKTYALRSDKAVLHYFLTHSQRKIARKWLVCTDMFVNSEF